MCGWIKDDPDLESRMKIVCRKNLSKQRIDRIMGRYFAAARKGENVKVPILRQVDSKITLVSSGQWESALAYRRKNIVRRVLIDYDRKSVTPMEIPVRLR